jgi:hypothetical protein
MIRRTRRRRRKLHSLKLGVGDDPPPVQVAHELEVGAAAGERLAGAVVRGYMGEKVGPGCACAFAGGEAAGDFVVDSGVGPVGSDVCS